MSERCVVSERERLADEYLGLVQARKNPDPEAFLARHPEHEAWLRPIVEGAAMLGAVMKRYEEESGTRLPEPED